MALSLSKPKAEETGDGRLIAAVCRAGGQRLVQEPEGLTTSALQGCGNGTGAILRKGVSLSEVGAWSPAEHCH